MRVNYRTFWGCRLPSPAPGRGVFISGFHGLRGVAASPVATGRRPFRAKCAVLGPVPGRVVDVLISTGCAGDGWAARRCTRGYRPSPFQGEMRGPPPGSGAGCGCVGFHGLRGGRLGRPSLHPWLHCCARVGAGGRLGWGLCANWALAWEMGIVFISGSSGLRANCCTFWGCRLPSPAPGRGFPGSWVPRVARRCRFTRGYRPSPFQGEMRGPPPGSGGGLWMCWVPRVARGTAAPSVAPRVATGRRTFRAKCVVLGWCRIDWPTHR